MDISTFPSVIKEHEGILRSRALRFTRNEADAEDLFQDVTIRAFNAWERFDGEYPKAWLLRIMENCYINLYRSRQRRPKEVSADSQLLWEQGLPGVKGAVDGADAYLENEFSQEMDLALRCMPEQFREALLMVDVDGLPYIEAAEKIGVPIGTIMSRVHRGRKYLKRNLVGTE